FVNSKLGTLNSETLFRASFRHALQRYDVLVLRVDLGSRSGIVLGLKTIPFVVVDPTEADVGLDEVVVPEDRRFELAYSLVLVAPTEVDPSHEQISLGVHWFAHSHAAKHFGGLIVIARLDHGA